MELEEEYSYWRIEYTSCEGNDRWTIARAPFDWTEYEVEDRITMGGCGDDPAEINSVSETCNTDYSCDFCD